MRLAELSLCLVLFFSAQVWAEESVTQENVQRTPQWTAKMQGLYQTLTQLMTDLSSQARFNAPDQKAKIESAAKKLAGLAHDLSQKKMSRPDQDPTVSMMSQLFADQANQAYQALKSGHREYGRGILKSISGYCIACHTRSNSGPQFAHLSLSPTAQLTSLELGEFYTASRQYDRALQEFQKLISDSVSAERSPLEWERAVRYSLAITVRVKKDPTLSEAIVTQILEAKNSPFFLKQDARQWKESVSEWKKEAPRKALTEEGYRAEAIRLLASAHQIQKYPMDRSAEVAYLRASASIHDWMQTYPKGKYLNEAYLMAGICYEVLRPINLGELHEMYYEACIKQTPQSEMAMNCFRRYEQSIYQGYTGSNGTHIPVEAKSKLRALEELAHPAQTIQN